MSDESKSLDYECPHCHRHIPVNEAAMGETVDCSNCGKPFRAEAPVARPVESSAAVTTGARREPADGHAEAPEIRKKASDEAEIRKVHPTIFRRHLLGTLLCGAAVVVGIAAVILGFAGHALFGVAGVPLMVIGALLALAPGFFLLKWFVLSRTSYLLLTTERVIYRRGIVNRQTTEIRHRDILNTTVEQSLKERLLKFGDIALSSAGDDGHEIVINDIPRPAEVSSLIGRQQ